MRVPLASFVAAISLVVGLLPITGHGAPRSSAERAAFVRHNPCPATGLRRGSCPGWEVDHVVALCAGGTDSRANMQWLTVQEHREKTRHDRRTCRALKKQ